MVGLSGLQREKDDGRGEVDCARLTRSKSNRFVLQLQLTRALKLGES